MYWWVICWLALMCLRAVTFGKLGYGVDSLILVVAVYGGVHHQLCLEAHWSWMPLYVMCSGLIFLFSLIMTASEPWKYLIQLFQSFCEEQVVRKRAILIRAVIVAVHEEVIWRVLLQSVLVSVIDAFLAVVLVAVAFTYWHRYRIKDNVAAGLEFFLFSLILGGCFELIHDPLIIFLIHSLRNYCIESYHHHVKATNAI